MYPHGYDDGVFAEVLALASAAGFDPLDVAWEAAIGVTNVDVVGRSRRHLNCVLETCTEPCIDLVPLGEPILGWGDFKCVDVPVGIEPSQALHCDTGPITRFLEDAESFAERRGDTQLERRGARTGVHRFGKPCLAQPVDYDAYLDALLETCRVLDPREIVVRSGDSSARLSSPTACSPPSALPPDDLRHEIKAVTEPLHRHAPPRALHQPFICGEAVAA